MGLCVLTVWNSRKEFFSGNNVCWDVVSVLWERLKGDHRWVSQIMKCVLSFIYFVKISLGLIMPGMCSTSTSFDWWHYRTILYRRFRCMMNFEVTETTHWTAALLSLYILVQGYASGIPISLARSLSGRISVAHLLVAMISASQKINAARFLQMDFHAIGTPDRQTRKPERERYLNNLSGVPS